MVNPQPLQEYKKQGDAKGLLEVIQSYDFGYEEDARVPKHWQKQQAWRKFLDCKQKQGQPLREHQMLFDA